MSNERLENIKKWYEQQQKVIVEVPPFISTQYNGTKVISRFNGYRMGNKYKFVNGKCTVDRNDLATLLEMMPNLIVHENEVQK